MSIREGIFESLKAGVPWKEVRSLTKSRSSLYQALDMYFDYIGDVVEDYQLKIKDIDRELGEKRHELSALKENINTMISDRKLLDTEISNKKSELDIINRKHHMIKGSYEEMNKKYYQLLEKGVTNEILTYLSSINFTSNIEFFNRIKTANSYQQLADEIEELTVKHEQIGHNIMVREHQLTVLRKNVKTEQNRLDEVKRQTWMYNETNTVIQGYLKVYSSETLISLLHVLDNLAVEGEPETSIKRLIEGLEGVRTLQELDSACRKEKATLDLLRPDREKTETELLIMRDNFKLMLNKIADALYEKLDENSSKISSQLNTLSYGISEHEKNLLDQLEKYRLNTETTLGIYSQSQINHVNKMITQLNRLIQQYEKKVKQWGEIKQEIGAIGEDIKSARLLKKMRSAHIQDLPISFIAQIMNAIQN